MVATYLPRDDLKTFQTTPTVSSNDQITSDEANLFIIYNMIFNSYDYDIYDLWFPTTYVPRNGQKTVCVNCHQLVLIIYDVTWSLACFNFFSIWLRLKLKKNWSRLMITHRWERRQVSSMSLDSSRWQSTTSSFSLSSSMYQCKQCLFFLVFVVFLFRFVFGCMDFFPSIFLNVSM